MGYIYSFRLVIDVEFVLINLEKCHYPGLVLFPIKDFVFIQVIIGFQINPLTVYGNNLIIAIIVISLIIFALVFSFPRKI